VRTTAPRTVQTAFAAFLTPHAPVTRAGNASKVSRQHAFIQLRKDGKFYVRNIGTHLTALSRLFIRLVSTPTHPHITRAPAFRPARSAGEQRAG
jgi:hypothetical protein